MFKSIAASTIRIWRQWLVVGLLMLMLLGGGTRPVQALPVASLHTYHERPGQTTFRSRQSFRDRNDRAWQTVLFKRYDDTQLQGLYLRLVGFPGIADIDATRPLQVLTGTTLQWQAAPALDPQTPVLPTNAAQYDVRSVFATLTKDIPLELAIPLQNARTATVVVPPYGVQEWRQLAEQQMDERG
ncbi:MAG: DUF3122 domain-containing protein [Cyanobacteria bacterium J06632_22]